MEIERFNKLLEIRIAKTREVLCSKGGEYGSDNERLHNFKVAAKIDLQKLSPEQALLGMWRKHLVSILDLIDAASTGKALSVGMVDEKIGDSINYLILLEALLHERLQLKEEPMTATDVLSSSCQKLADNCLRESVEREKMFARQALEKGYRYDDLDK